MQTRKQIECQQLADEIKKEGFRVFIAEAGDYGMFSNPEGTRVVCFGFSGAAGLSFSGNYKTDAPRSTGSGWGLPTDLGYAELLVANPPEWAVRHATKVHMTTLDEHMATYQSSSKYREVE